jgi:SAM-dependent methyltransferase
MNDGSAKQIAQAVAEFYEKHGAAFARTRGFVWAEEKLITKLIQPGMTVVDVGAGNGRFARLLEGVAYIGIEPSSSLRAAADPSLDMRDGTLPNLPLPDAVADVTVCLAVFHHLAPDSRLQASVQELIRITKPGGLIAASAWWIMTVAGDAGGEASAARAGEFDKPSTGGVPQAAGPATDNRHDLWIPWRAEGVDAKRFVHAFSEEEWKKLWTRPELEIERVGLFGKEDWTNDPKEARNLLVIAKKRP